eukprot:scaffold248999_cov30-Tisochrysis_lutea.AAC.1
MQHPSKRARVEPKLVLPAEHALSLKLAAEAEELARQPPRGVLHCCVLSKGLVEILLHVGSASGLGARDWPLLVGGQGVGDDPDIAAAIGASPRSPIAVRFGVLIPLDQVDDAGFCDSSFWDPPGLRESPTLKRIVERAIEWLEVPPEGADLHERWMRAGELAAAKAATIATYRRQARAADLLSEVGLLRAEWFCNSEVGKLLCPPAMCPEDAVLAASRAAAFVAPPAPDALVMALEPEPMGEGIYRFQLFTPTFCEMLMTEIRAFEATTLPRRRPNSMNRGGVVLSDIGMEPLMSELTRRLVAPLADAFYGDSEAFGRSIDHHHSFIVAYRHAEGDKGLDLHHDASEVTLNVCLGGDFKGGALRFCGQFGASSHRKTHCVADHSVGWAILHLGRQRHGADDIERGERLNLIVWARSSAFRSAAAYGHIAPDGYPKAAEVGEPDRLCLSQSNDDDYEEQVRLWERRQREKNT